MIKFTFPRMALLVIISILSFQVNAQSCYSSNVITGATTVCGSNNSGIVYITGVAGTVVRWEKSVTGGSPWTTIQNTSDTLNYLNLIATTYFRAIVQIGICAEGSSNAVTIYVDNPTVGGNLTGNASTCTNVNYGSLILTSYTGNIVKWQKSTDNGLNWSDLSNTTNIQNYSGLTTTTKYRVNVKNGVCSSDLSTEGEITIYPEAVVDFTFTGLCEDNPTTFANASTITSGSIIDHQWDFDDGSGSIAESPIHTFQNSRTFFIKLTETSNHGCINSITKQLDIDPIPTMGFTQNDVCNKFPMNFTNTSYIIGGTISSYQWDFGDGSAFSTIQNPTYTYGQDSSFTVNLMITSNKGCVDSISKAVNVYPRTNPSFYATNSCLGKSVNIQNNTVISSGSLSYLWQFNDGNSSIDINPVHNYSNSGTYNIVLITTTDHACKDTINHIINVYPQPEAKFYVKDICYRDTARFVDSSVTSSPNIAYSWAFGDQDFSNSQNPDHYYQAQGNYLVNLTISTDSGCTSSYSKNINVFSLPFANFLVSDVCAEDSIQATNLSYSQMGDLDFMWHFGNGDSSLMSSPVYLYPAYGTYKIRLIANTVKGCKDTTYNNVTIHPRPAPDFTFQNKCDGFPVIFSNTSTIANGEITKNDWDFDDGTNSIQIDPTKLYLNPGFYKVNLNTVSDFGCDRSTYKFVKVYVLPLANFSADNECFGTPIHFDNSSAIDSGSLSYVWRFNDSISSTLPSAIQNFKQPGVNKATLIATSNYGCIDSLIRYVETYSLPKIQTNEDTTVSKGYPVQLNTTGGLYYAWSPVDGLSSPFISNPIATPQSTSLYLVKGEDANGCINYDSVQISPLNDFRLEANNVITPNGDGINDYWEIYNISTYSKSTVSIFDRWGAKVYSKTGYANDWDGRNSNLDILPDGTYYYVVSFDDSETYYSGAITILRNNK